VPIKSNPSNFLLKNIIDSYNVYFMYISAS